MLKTKQREQLSGWLCLLAGVLHLLAPLCPACPALNPKAKAGAMGRVTAESSHGQVHHYEYDLAGNRVKATYSTGRIVETSYDGLNRPEAIVDGDRLTRYGYDKAGRAVILIAANGQTSSNTYDALGRLTDRVLYKTPAMDPAQRLAQFRWEHDLLGNVTKQEEIWPGEPGRAGELRRTTMGYDANNRLTSETIWTFYETWDEATTTTYTYDEANNRRTKTITGGAEPGHWDYDYNAANQLTAWEHLDYPGGSVLRSASLTYDEAGNRTSQAVTQVSGSYNPAYNPQPAVSGLTTYTWDAQDRLASVTLPGQPGTENSEPRTFSYAYDYRTRRVGTVEQTLLSAAEKRTSITFSGGLSVAEWEQESGTGLQPVLSAPPTVEYTRGPDMGGGVGGLLYTSRSESASASVSSSRTLRYNLSNGRGDIVAQSDSYASLTWTASYEAYGKRTKETGTNLDKQRGNSKDEDPTGLLNEGFRYRDIETGIWLSRDPAGFVDGPNLYAYVKQNPWTKFDPSGLSEKDAGTVLRERGEVLKQQMVSSGNKHGAEIQERMQNAGKAAASNFADGADFGISLTPLGSLNELLSGKNAKQEKLSFGERIMSMIGLIPGGKVLDKGADALGASARFAAKHTDEIIEGAIKGSDKLSGALSKTHTLQYSDEEILLRGLDKPWPALDNYRGRFNALRHQKGLPRLPDEYDAHHRIPQEYMGHSDFADFDFHSPSNIQGVKGSRADVNVHQEITNDWAQFRIDFPDANGQQISNFASEIDSKYQNHWFK